MYLYYTTTAGQDTERKDPNLSLGGYRSSTMIPNGRLNNLFGEVSPQGIKNNQPEYIAIFLRNESGSDVSSINVYFTYPEDCYTKFEIAAVSPTLDSENIYYMENVQDRYSQPYVATFYEADGVDNAVSLGALQNNLMIGIWLKRTILTDIITDDWDNKISKSGDVYVETALGTEDNISMSLVYS